MVDQVLTIRLSEEAYAHLQEDAARSNRPAEEILADLTAIMLTPLPDQLDDILAAMPHFTDDQLWRVASLRLTLADEHDLSALNAKPDLTPAEQTRHEAILEQVERQELLRAKALVVLKQRGHNVEAYLGLAVD